MATTPSFPRYMGNRWEKQRVKSSKRQRTKNRTESDHPRGRSYRFSTRLYAKHSHAWACADFAFHSRCFYATHRPSFFAFRRSTIGLVLHNTRCVVLFFFLLATPAGIALFSPPFFRVANVDAIFPPAFFPPPSPPRSPCKSNRSWCVSFFFSFLPLPFLLSILLFYPLITFYLFVHQWEIVQSSVSLISISTSTVEINSFRREMKKVWIFAFLFLDWEK